MGELKNINKNKFTFNRNHAKGTLAALFLSLGLIAGCPQPTGPEIPTGTTPTTITTPSTPTASDTPATTNTPATAVPAHNSTYGDAPYDANLGNGFNLHNFVGENTEFNTNVYNKMNYYFGEQSVPYIKDRVQRWYQGMNAESKAYFQDFYDAVMAIQFTIGSAANGLDGIINTIVNAALPYANDIVENLDDCSERFAYDICWNVHYGEGYKEGMGKYRTCQSQMYEYDYGLSSDNINQSGIKNYAMLLAQDNQIFINAGVNLQQEYANNNFAGTTQLYRNLLAKVANKKGVETNAMVEMHDIWAFTGSLAAAHQRTAGQNLVQHSNCEYTFNRIGNRIESKINNLEMNNSLSM